MVFYFYPRGWEEGRDDWLIYMGKDKFENEDLIKHGLPLDLWFHVDDMSSAHVYLRLPPGATFDEIPADTLDDCAQLVKANSIQGCKLNNITIVYTPWANLKKGASMDVGQVGFHNQKSVRKVRVEKKNNDTINRLEKTKKELYPDLQAERQAYDALQRGAKHAELRATKAADKVAREEKQQADDQRSYRTVMQEENMVSNKELAEKYQSAQDYEDDFM